MLNTLATWGLMLSSLSQHETAKTVTHAISASLPLVEHTLLAQGWQADEPVCDVPDACSGGVSGSVGLSLLHPGMPSYRVYVWDTHVRQAHLPMLHGCVSEVRMQGPQAQSQDVADLLTQDLQTGIALRRHDLVVHGTRLPWIELRHAAHEIDDYISTAQSPLWCAPTVSADNDADVAISLPWMPPVEPLGDALIDTILWRDNEDDKQVALTFDACSTFYHGAYNRAVIDTLVKESIPATLFIGGHWAETHPAELQFLAAHPQFELGNHTYSHPHMTQLSPEHQREELLWTQYLIFTLTGHVPRFRRPPYGETDDALTYLAARLGLYTVEFDLPAGDADLHIDPARLQAWVLHKATSGSIVVMHMNHPTSKTALVLPQIANTLRARGYTFAKVSDLLARMRNHFHRPPA